MGSTSGINTLHIIADQREKHMIISTDAEQGFDKIQTPLHDKNTQLGI